MKQRFQIEMQVIKIEPGLVLLRNFANDDECQELAKLATEGGESGDGGLYMHGGKEKSLNTGENRGRIEDGRLYTSPSPRDS